MPDITKAGYSYFGGKIEPENRFGIVVTIGKFTSVAHGVQFIGGNHPCVNYPQSVSTYPFAEKLSLACYPKSDVGKPITIGNDVWVCTNASILEGVTIGDGAVVGACSVVTNDIPPYAVFAGNPARWRKSRFPEDIIKKLLIIAWWNWPDEIIKERIEDFKDIKVFVEKYGI